MKTSVGTSLTWLYTSLEWLNGYSCDKSYVGFMCESLNFKSLKCEYGLVDFFHVGNYVYYNVPRYLDFIFIKNLLTRQALFAIGDIKNISYFLLRLTTV